MRLPFGQLEGDHAFGLDMAMGAGIGHDGSGAKRAFLGMDIGLKRHLRTTAGAICDARLLHLFAGQFGGDRRLVIQLNQRGRFARPWAMGACINWGSMAAMIAQKPPLAWSKAQVRAAFGAGKARLLQ